MYAAGKRQEADEQAKAIVQKAGEDADAQVEERRAAAQSELDGLSKHITELQQREAAITQRVSELRAMFSQAFANFGFGQAPAEAEASLPVVTPVPGEDDHDDESDQSAADEPDQADQADQTGQADEPQQSDENADTENADGSQPAGHDQDMPTLPIERPAQIGPDGE